MLTTNQRRFWDENGFLVLSGFYSAGDLDPVERLTESVWDDPPPWLVVDGTKSVGRRRLIDVPADDRRGRYFKLNDLYLEWDAVRTLALGRLTLLLNSFMGEPAVLCNSLTFERGSQQPAHIDSLYMTPRTPGKLVASWVAMEDAHPDAGQLFYYPGSHTIPRYRFSDGTHHAVMAELPQWTEYVESWIAKRGLTRHTFSARRGDVLIWSADLVHGGSAIRDPNRTRKSLVCHYYAASDCRALRCTLASAGAGYWMRRSHPPLPGLESVGRGSNLGQWVRKFSPGRLLKRVVG